MPFEPRGAASGTRRPSVSWAASTRFTSPTGCIRLSAAGVRATTIHDLVPLHHPEWTTARTRSMHGRKYANAAASCDVIFCNSAYTGRDVTTSLGVPAERIRVAHPAPKDVYRADGPAADLGAPYVLTVATLEPRKNLEVLVEAQRLFAWRARARGRRRRGLGGAAAPRRTGHPSPRLRLGRRARPSLPRRGRRRVSLPLRGLRDPGDRGDGLRRPGGRLVARVARRSQRGCGTPRRSGRRRCLRRRDLAGTWPRGSDSQGSASSTRADSPGGRSVRSSSAGTRRCAGER